MEWTSDRDGIKSYLKGKIPTFNNRIGLGFVSRVSDQKPLTREVVIKALPSCLSQ